MQVFIPPTPETKVLFEVCKEGIPTFHHVLITACIIISSRHKQTLSELLHMESFTFNILLLKGINELPMLPISIILDDYVPRMHINCKCITSL